jgi:hypothetical protein
LKEKPNKHFAYNSPKSSLLVAKNTPPVSLTISYLIVRRFWWLKKIDGFSADIKICK